MLLQKSVFWVYNENMISYMPLMRTLDEKGITFIELEHKVTGSDYNHSSLKQTINRGGYLRISTLLKFAEILECKVEDLIEWNEGEGVQDVKYIDIDWDKLKGLCSLKQTAEAIGHHWNFLIKAKSRGAGLSPIDVEKISKLLGVEKEAFVK